MDLEVAVVGVGLAREQAFELALLRLLAEFFERCPGLRDNPLIALGLAQADQLDRILDLAFDPAVALDRPLQAGALAPYLLRFGLVIPQLGVFGLGVQLGEAAVGRLPVKDASSAAPATS